MDNSLTRAAQPALSAFEAAIQSASALIVTYSFTFIGAILVLILGVLVARQLERWARSGLSRISGFDRTIIGFLSLAVKYAVMVLVIVTVLAQFGVQTTSIIAALGAAGLAIGLALQGTLQNIAAGLMLLILRPIRVGEYIEAGDVKGCVTVIGLFNSEFLTPDGLFASVPNSQLFTRTIVNFDRNGTRRFDLDLKVSDATDVAALRKQWLALARSDKRVLRDPEPAVFLKMSGDATLATLRIWVKSQDYLSVTASLIESTRMKLEKATLAAA